MKTSIYVWLGGLVIIVSILISLQTVFAAEGEYGLCSYGESDYGAERCNIKKGGKSNEISGLDNDCSLTTVARPEKYFFRSPGSRITFQCLPNKLGVHKVTASTWNVRRQEVTLIIESTPRIVTLKKGAYRKFDFDQDGTYDLGISIDRIADYEVATTFTVLNETDPRNQLHTSSLIKAITQEKNIVSPSDAENVQKSKQPVRVTPPSSLPPLSDYQQRSQAVLEQKPETQKVTPTGYVSFDTETDVKNASRTQIGIGLAAAMIIFIVRQREKERIKW